MLKFSFTFFKIVYRYFSDLFRTPPYMLRRYTSCRQLTLFFKNGASVQGSDPYCLTCPGMNPSLISDSDFCQAWERCPRSSASRADQWTRPENAGVPAGRHLGRTWGCGQPPAPPSQRTGTEHQLAAILGAPGVVGSRQPLLASGQVQSTSWPPSSAHFFWAPVARA